MSRKRSMFIALCLASCASAATAKPALPALKQEAVAEVDGREKLAQVMNDQLFSYAELGFQEFETQKYLTEMLEKEGFTVERGTAGIPSAWVARWTHGKGGPVIGLGSDIDGIPRASQKPGVPWHEPLVEGGPGHGEGHNSGQAVNIVAALAVKDLMTKHDIPGTLVIWPGVAEELVAGKAFLVRAGVFKDVDAVLFTHVGHNLSTAWGQPNGTGDVAVEYTFKGASAHAAGSPWKGRSALDGVMLMATGWEYQREHLRPEQRSHYVIRNGGDQPNVVPSEASINFVLREMTFERIQNSYDAANRIADGAAIMSNTSVTHRLIGTAAPRHFNRPIAEAAYDNIKLVGLPRWTADEQAFAKAVQQAAKADKITGLDTTLAPLRTPEVEPKSGGSDDIGDVSWTVPTITIIYPANIDGLPGHNWADAISMATPIAHKGVVAGSKAMALTMIDLLTRPALVRDAKQYFTQVQSRDQKYIAMLRPDDMPPIEINADIMARYKPELRKFYYDPAKYGTYLEQLGVKWPTLSKTDPAK